MGGPDALAVLFYTQNSTTDLTIGTNGTSGQRTNSKILWLAAGSPEGPLTLEAINLTTGTETTQEFDGGGNYPSIPVLPDQGCWRLTIRVDSAERLTITLRAEDRPS